MKIKKAEKDDKKSENLLDHLVISFFAALYRF